ncbi:MAG: glycine zipper domain-containing protein [Candidatus Omnitrophica bacterium]|nr:glycine zipper domain-containing protein [Candidatus Omnitrophota bacterium]
MKKLFVFLSAAAFLAALAGCETNKTRIAEGAGVGGAVGALAGGIIGYQSGHAVQGALIGGALGAGGGAAVGSQINKPNQPTQAAQTTPLSMTQIVNLSKQGTSSDEIINRIKASNSKFSLTTEDVDYLKKQGVSQRVIEAMQGL